MIIHIGDNITLLEKDIVAILDIKTVLESIDNRQLIDDLIKDNCLVNDRNKDIKSYIIVNNANYRRNRDGINQYKLYASNISSTSLIKRIYKNE